MIGIIIAFVVVLFGIKYWWDYSEFGQRQHKLRKYFTAPPAHWLFGNLLELNGGPAQLTQKLVFDWYEKYPSPLRIAMGPIHGIHLYKAEHMEAVFKDTKNIRKGQDYELVKDWLGNGLLLSDGPKWLKRRKMLTPAFHFAILKNFLPIFNQQSKILVELLREDAAKHKAAFDIRSRLSICSLDIICESAMGKKINAQRDTNNPYVQAIKDFGDLGNYRGVRPWLWNDFIMYNFTLNMGKMWKSAIRRLHQFPSEIIKSRAEERKTEPKVTHNSEDEPVKKRNAFLELLLDEQDKGQIDMEGIKEEVDTFMFEGHDTTATGLMWAVYSFARHPDIQERCREEIMGVLGDREEITSDDLPQFKYLDYCLKESQRMWPSVPIIERVIDVPLKLNETQTIPKGTTVAMTIFGLHRDPDHFPNPEKFDPDRFLPENTIGRHPFAFVPFAAGTRNCIGQKYAQMETKVVVSYLLRNFKFECSQKEEDMAPAMVFILRPSKGVWVKLTPL